MKKIYSTTNGFVGYHYFLIQAPSHRWDFFQSFFLQNRAQRGWILEAPPWSRPKIEVWPMAIWKKSPRSLGDTELGTNSSLEQRRKSSLSAEKGGKKIPQIFHVPKKKSRGNHHHHCLKASHTGHIAIEQNKVWQVLLPHAGIQTEERPRKGKPKNHQENNDWCFESAEIQWSNTWISDGNTCIYVS